MTAIVTLGFSPGAIANIVWFGFGGVSSTGWSAVAPVSTTWAGQSVETTSWSAATPASTTWATQTPASPSWSTESPSATTWTTIPPVE